MLPLSQPSVGSAGPAAPLHHRGALTPSSSASIFGGSTRSVRSLGSSAYYREAMSTSNSDWFERYVRRGFNFRRWDLEYLVYQLVYAVRSPGRIYQLTQLRRQTKGSWARDDASYAILLFLLLGISAISWAIAYNVFSLTSILWLIFQFWLHLIFVGGITCGMCWYIANTKLRRGVSTPHSVEQQVDPFYAWDVVCNSFTAVMFFMHFGLLITAPLVLSNQWISSLFGNTLVACGVATFWYNIFRGYHSKSCSDLY